ncbi:hypothetical protein [Acetobacterium wieringae]|uniref:Uncharacterized protein n=1 Tax=Acetobacterium wieringae TaxID=52694 RepID=A0A1F2PMA5_9FIRM|nr:hypothetical protein [Acetobacterium wieringae]OFV72467.1 hypothetical protein ACWI_00700 [Acetobacterium wieringae]
MNTNHTWIKYLAIAFGLVLALGIISSIVNGGVALLRGFGFIDNRPPSLNKIVIASSRISVVNWSPF